MILSQARDRAQLEAVVATDPFHIHGAARHEIVEFEVGKTSAGFKSSLAEQGA